VTKLRGFGHEVTAEGKKSYDKLIRKMKICGEKK
jgi:hypothetical protein